MTGTNTVALTIALALAFSTTATVAGADERASPATQEPSTSRPAWYGWQTLGVDLVTLPVVYGGLAADNAGIILGGFSGYVAGGGVVHAIRGNWGRAAGSVGLRFALPSLGLIKGLGDCEWDKDEQCKLPNVYATVGIAIASIIDAALLAHDGEPERPSSLGLRLTPSLAAGPRGGGLGVSGSF